LKAIAFNDSSASLSNLSEAKKNRFLNVSGNKSTRLIIRDGASTTSIFKRKQPMMPTTSGSNRNAPALEVISERIREPALIRVRPQSMMVRNRSHIGKALVRHPFNVEA
jgi:hypothetical protein